MRMFRIPYLEAGIVSALRVVTLLTLPPAALQPNNTRSLETVLGRGALTHKLRDW
jgi:hypothetical protein